MYDSLLIYGGGLFQVEVYLQKVRQDYLREAPGSYLPGLLLMGAFYVSQL